MRWNAACRVAEGVSADPVGKGGRFGLTQWTDLLTGVASTIIMSQSKW